VTWRVCFAAGWAIGWSDVESLERVRASIERYRTVLKRLGN
jgi:hypothetical protein